MFENGQILTYLESFLVWIFFGSELTASRANYLESTVDDPKGKSKGKGKGKDKGKGKGKGR